MIYYLSVRILTIVVLFAALHVHRNILEKTLQDKLIQVVLFIYLLSQFIYLAGRLVLPDSYYYISAGEPINLHYGFLLLLYYQAGAYGRWRRSTFVWHGTPLLLFWGLFIVFLVSPTFRQQIGLLYYAILYGATGLSLTGYALYTLYASRKGQRVMNRVVGFSWFCVLTGTFMLLIARSLFLRHLEYPGEIAFDKSGSIMVAVFLLLGSVILFDNRLDRFRAQYHPKTRKPDEPSETTTEEKKASPIPLQASSVALPDDKIALLHDFFESEIVCQPFLDTKMVADVLKMTQRELKQGIREEYGTTFTKLLAEKRIQQTCMYLESKGFDDDYDTLSIRSGFSSKATFYRNFKQITGYSPSEYRNVTID